MPENRRRLKPASPLAHIPSDTPRVLLFSQRNVEVHMWEAPQLEFEDIILEVESARLLAPPNTWTSSRSMWMQRAGNVARRLTGRAKAWPIAPQRVEGEYDLFFATFHFLRNVAMVNQLRELRARCKLMACFLIEVWSPELRKGDPYIELLAQFDHIFVFNGAIADRLQALTGRPCTFLPTAVDAFRFSPYPVRPERTVDVYNFGRGSDVIHRQLQAMAERDELFYVHARVNHAVPDYRAHRVLVANLMRRSRFFLAHKINEDRRPLTGGDEALATRFFEGVAGGAVLLGSRPACPEFDACFPWDDVVLPVPWKPADLGAVLREIDAQPERLAHLRRENATQALRRHDWAHRWAHVLETVGLAPLPALRARTGALEALADEALVRPLPEERQTFPPARDSRRGIVGV